MRYKPFTFLGSNNIPSGCISASGGQEITVGNFKYHIFSGSGTFTVHSNPCSDSIFALAVGRGGNGGTTGATRHGAGAGGGVTTSSFAPITGSYNMSIDVSGSFGNGDSIAFSGSGNQIIAERGGNGATSTTAAQNGGGGNIPFPTGSVNVYGFRGTDFNEGGLNQLGAGAGAGGDGDPRSGDSTVGGIGVYVAEFAPLDGQFFQIYYGGYPAGFYGGGGGGNAPAATPVQIGEAVEGGGGRNFFPGAYKVGIQRALNGVPFTGGGGVGGNTPVGFNGNGSGGSGAIYIRYQAP